MGVHRVRPRAVAATIAVAATASGSLLLAGSATPSTGGAGYGHLAAPGWPGSFTGGTFTQGYPNHFVAQSNTTYYYCDFRNDTWVGTPSWSTNITATNVRFVGCRFAQSANVPNNGDNSLALVHLYADGVTFDYCTFQPDPTVYPTVPAGVETAGNPSTFVEYGKGYQYGIRGSGGSYTHVGALNVNHCEFWGFGNCGLDLTNSTVAKPHVVTNSWFHHSADPFTDNNTATQFHNDVWLVDNGNYYGAQCLNNVMEIWGNTNLIAFQGSGSFDDAVIVGNRFSGCQESIALSATGSSVRITFTDNVFSTRIGRSVGTGKPLRSWAVTDSGTGSTWRRNTYLVDPGASIGNYPGMNWGSPSWNGQYWWPGDTDSTGGHATDYTG